MSAVPAQPGPTWEEVLASFERTAEHAEALLATDADPGLAAAVITAYHPWQPVLPPLPDALRARAVAAHDRQARLIAALQDAMLTIRRHEQLAASTAHSRRSSYLDRTA